MKLSADSPKLTAYALVELNAAERVEVEATLDASPELRAELVEIQRTIGALDFAFSTEPAVVLSPEQRAAIVGQAASLPSTDLVRDEVTTLTSPAPEGHFPEAVADPACGSESRAPIWWERLLQCRQQLIWASAGACALALTFTLWPRQRAAVENASELRYQRLPESQANSLEVAGAPATPMRPPASSSPVPVAAPASVPVKKESAQSTASGRLESVTVAPAPRPAPTTKIEAPAHQRAADPAANAPAAPAPLPMEPVLAQRYGLRPAPGSVPAKPAPVAPTGTPQLASRYGLRAEAGRAKVSESLASAAAPGFVGGAMPAIAPLEDREDRYYRYQLIHPVAGGEGYEAFADNDFKAVSRAPLSTFSLDVDTASYANVRRFLREGSLPPRDAVRLEELINYFHYDYPQPKGEHPFIASIEVAESPWKEGHKLVRIGLQTRSLDRGERPPANLVFLVDVSGSMAPENKLPLVKSSLRLLLDRLSERDRVGVVTYAAGSQVAAEPTAVNAAGKAKLLKVIDGLSAGSGTHGSAGIQMAYAMATNHFNVEHVNRVLLCTDGDFNVGITDRAQLLDFITERAKTGVFLSVLGYGMGNYQDRTTELLADKGNGNYAYLDSFTEARKVLAEQLEGTLVTVAKDVKVQVEFNPARVKSYRLLGYESRALKDRDFNDDTKDAGEVGAGHQVTVLYEIEPAVPNLAGVDPLRYQGKPVDDEVKKRLKPEHGDELLNLKLRYKLPDGTTSRLVETPVKDGDREFAQASHDFKFAAAVAGYGMLLRQSPHAGELTWEKISHLAEQGLGEDKESYRAEFVDLVRRAGQLGGGVRPMPEPMPVPMLKR